MNSAFHSYLDKIDSLAGKTGSWINSKATKAISGVIFGIILVFFGFIVFTSKFFRSLFGFKE